MTRLEQYQKLHEIFLVNRFSDVLTEAEEDDLLYALDAVWWQMTSAEHAEAEKDTWMWNRVLRGWFAHIDPAGGTNNPVMKWSL